MAQVKTLTRAIYNFLKTHPDYKLNYDDVGVCLELAQGSFSRAVFSVEAEVYKLRTELQECKEQMARNCNSRPVRKS